MKRWFVVRFSCRSRGLAIDSCGSREDVRSSPAMTAQQRRAGVLLHPTSLPGPFGIGDVGPTAVKFLDWAAAAGQNVWQLLPLNPPGFGNSPYGALSAFAGNPLLISPERLVEEGLATEADVVPSGDASVDFGVVTQHKERLLRESLQRFRGGANEALHEAFRAFRDDVAQRYWLPDFSLFLALKKRFADRPWPEWDEPFVSRDEKALASARRDLAGEIEFHEFVQFLFHRQWWRLRHEAYTRGVQLMGDMPIYVAYDGADVWCHPELFMLDEKHRPIAVAGVPPDYFSETGQRWGNPLYRWDVMRKRGFEWWTQRIAANLRLTDVVRLDHFRGFAGFWQIPAQEETAVHGHWEKGPGIALFDALRQHLGGLPLVAEDLGTITPDVDELRKAIGVPGMKVLQFGFGSDDNIHLPHHHTVDTVVYTGTHDNDTTAGWFESAEGEERRRVEDYFGNCGGEIHWRMIRAAYGSVAALAIVPLQDIFGLGSEARMNTPGDSAGNWGWRAPARLFEDEAAQKRLNRLAVVTGRAAQAPRH
jgi:4-alpha-glucanotransferase